MWCSWLEVLVLVMVELEQWTWLSIVGFFVVGVVGGGVLLG